VKTIERTGVRQRKVINEHSLATEEATKSHRNLPPYLHSLGAVLEDCSIYQLYRKASKLKISLFPKLHNLLYLKSAVAHLKAKLMLFGGVCSQRYVRLQPATRAIERGDTGARAAMPECPRVQAKARGWGRTPREKEPAPKGSRTHCGSR